MEHKGRSLISASFVFVGLLVPLRFPEYFWHIVIFVAACASLLTFWVFSEKPNLNRVKEDWFTLLFILVFTLNAGVFAYLIPHPIVQALLLGSIGFSVYFIYQVASRLKRNYNPSLFLRNVVSIFSMLGVFFSISNVLRWASISDNTLTQIFIIFSAFFAIFIISEFLFEVHGFESSLLYSLTFSFIVAQITWISSFWLISYPASEKAISIGVPLPAVVGTVFFYLFWGLSHHRVEGTLSRRVLWEYILISTIFLIILFLTAKWLPQVR